MYWDNTRSLEGDRCRVESRWENAGTQVESPLMELQVVCDFGGESRRVKAMPGQVWAGCAHSYYITNVTWNHAASMSH
jgi:hypothetical protein